MVAGTQGVHRRAPAAASAGSPSATGAVIAVDDVRKAYGSVKAVDGVSFEVRKGEIFGLLGRNGAGKTTLLSMIAGQERPSSGTVRILGHDPVESLEVLSRTSFVRDSQRWPDDFRIGHVLSVAPAFHAGWDPTLLGWQPIPQQPPQPQLPSGPAQPGQQEAGLQGGLDQSGGPARYPEPGPDPRTQPPPPWGS